MDFNFYFIELLIALNVAVIVFVVKVYRDTIILNTKAMRDYDFLDHNISIEEKKGKTQAQHIVLLDDLNLSLFRRLFEIINRLLLL